MNAVTLTLSGERLSALGTGALWWAARRTLIVSDLHLGKAERIARRAGQMLPPYETRDTLDRLAADIAATQPACLICLGDSLDDNAARAGIDPASAANIRDLQQGRDWIWIAGNHDPAPVDLGGTNMDEITLGPLTFRHIAAPGATGELSGHYHPKARLTLRGKQVSRPCFLQDGARIILPAYGTYTGGLDWTAPVLTDLMAPGAQAILTGPHPCAFPMPHRARA